METGSAAASALFVHSCAREPAPPKSAGARDIDIVMTAGVSGLVVHEVAKAQGSVVLLCRPVEAEVKLSFAALGDLLAPVVDAGRVIPATSHRAGRGGG